MNLPIKDFPDHQRSLLFSFILLLAMVLMSQAQSPLSDDFNPGADGPVYAMAVQTDGRILVGGDFTGLAGEIRRKIGRIHADGSLDLGFSPQIGGGLTDAPASVFSLNLQTDGKILVGGNFATINGQTRQSIARLDAQGALDREFTPGTDGPVYSLMTQMDGKILMAGSFTMVGDQKRQYIARLNNDGTLDSEFKLEADSAIYCLAMQGDGKILIGGMFTKINNEPHHYIARLNSNGTFDPEFNPGAGGEIPYVYTVAVQADGKILVGGWFTELNGQERHCLGRLEADGTLDLAFNPNVGGQVFWKWSDHPYVSALSVQTDGYIVVGGMFSSVGGQSRSSIARLNADGILDSEFNPDVNTPAYVLTLQTDGKILVGGDSSSLDGVPRNPIVRLSDTKTVDQNLACNGSTIVWTREGASPEIHRSTFDYSTNGIDWISLGNGIRTANGWQLNGSSDCFSGSRIRARGYVAGDHKGSGWFVESKIGAPCVLLEPNNATNPAGTTAMFHIAANGSEPLDYQWRKDGVALIEGGKFIGTASPTLAVKSVLKYDEGGYGVIVRNSEGSVASSVARLNVIDPWISTQPRGQNTEAGQSGILQVEAEGTDLCYQWQRDGVLIPGETGALLTLTNLQGTQAGRYTVAVSNQYGSVTSTPALLTINMASRDIGFSPQIDSPDHLTGISSLAIQADGKILVGGYFSKVNLETRQGIARLEADGILDTGFTSGANGYVVSLLLQLDGKILVAGCFTELAGQPRPYVGRLNIDGSLDLEFNPKANNCVWGLALQPDGKILAGGPFTQIGDLRCNGLVRLNADGSVDAGFHPVTTFDVSSIALQRDGKILAGGTSGGPNGALTSYVSRLLPDGSLDSGFQLDVNGRVDALIVQADGKILVGGEFTRLNRQARFALGRLYSDGTVDLAFDANPNNPVKCMAIQADGMILVGGEFTEIAGVARHHIARLEPNGTPDFRFNPGIKGRISLLVVQPNGNLLVGDNIIVSEGLAKGSICRFNAIDLAIHKLIRNASKMSWLCGGTSPDVWNVQFDHSPDGASWTSLGTGSPMADGWQIDNLVLPTGGTVRARGYVTGISKHSGWFVETMTGAPAISLQPFSVVHRAGSSASLSVAASGTEPLRYQWYKDGSALVDDKFVTGANTPNLRIAGLLKHNEGAYYVSVENSEGSTTSARASLTVVDPILIAQPLGQVRTLGQDVSFSATAIGTALRYQWWRDRTTLPRGTNATLTLTNLQASDAGYYSVVVHNTYGSVTSGVAVLTINSTTLDSAFAGKMDAPVFALAAQDDGKILIGGRFSEWAGMRSRPHIGRLNVDGFLDLSFNPGADGEVTSLVVQPDGKILAGGGFTQIAGTKRNRIARLHADGTPELAFNPDANDSVDCLALQADGSILLGGAFTRISGEPRNHLARLKADGTLDPEFRPEANERVISLAVGMDGAVLASGMFTRLGGQSRSCIGRLRSDGTLDSDFDPSANNFVYALIQQPDGMILVGGEFTMICGQTQNCIARLKANGTLDSGFNSGANGVVTTLALQADGRILVGGGFTTYAGQERLNVCRLEANGWLDPTFNPGANNVVYALGLQSDGKVLVGGAFNELQGQLSSGMGRLNTTTPAVQSLVFDRLMAVWRHGGSGPNFCRATFDHSIDGLTWTPLGSGFHFPGGWQLTGLSLPSGGTMRARGYVTGGKCNASSWYVEAFAGIPILFAHPQSRTNNASTVASFKVLAKGTEPLAYQWFKDGTALIDCGNITGAQASSLTITNVLQATAGEYVVVVANAAGSVTSSVATLTVLDPAITRYPDSETRNAGQTVTLTVTAVGTTPLIYQWLKDGLPLAQYTNTTLTITNLQGFHGGLYTLVVNNLYGNSTSVVARLTVIDPVIAIHPKSQNLERGQTATLSVTASGAALMYQWWKDGFALPQATMPVLAFPKLTGFDAGSYWVVVNSQFGCLTSQVAMLTVNCAILDREFNPGVNGTVVSLAVQADRKILIGGSFSIVQGKPRSNIARLNPDGTLDLSFNADVYDPVLSLAVQPDGRILIGSAFSQFMGRGRSGVARLEANGMLDPEFNPRVNSEVAALALQADGKILVGGAFSAIDGQTRNGIARLNADGTLDSEFNPGVNNTVTSFSIQTNGQILVGGAFSILCGEPSDGIGRLNPDGTLDSGFHPQVDYPMWWSRQINSLAVQVDGKILLGGNFSAVGALPRIGIARLNADGTLDSDFNPQVDQAPWTSPFVNSLAIQTDGKILLGGSFDTISKFVGPGVARLNADGSLDMQFNPGAGGIASAVAVQPDGKLLVGGTFTNLAGQSCNYLGRLNNSEPATENLVRDGTRVTWARGGASPEVWRTTFDYSTNNVTWTPLGEGSRVDNGWQLDGISLPLEAVVRARGFVVGDSKGAGWHVQGIAGLPIEPWILSQPESQIGEVGHRMSLQVIALGNSLRYQWYKNAVPIMEGASAILTFTNLQSSDAGLYQVVVSNPYGSATSMVAMLTVNAVNLDPGFNCSVNLGVVALAVQSNGMILAGGGFYELNGHTCQGLARLNDDGTTDPNFSFGIHPNTIGLNPNTIGLMIKPDGRIIVGGQYGELNDHPSSFLQRLYSDGTLDSGFDPNASAYVFALVEQADGKTLLGGAFTNLFGRPHFYLGRLTQEDVLDLGFNSQIDSSVYTLLILGNGKILVGTSEVVESGTQSSLVRLNGDGTLDQELDGDVKGWISALSSQADGKILVAGSFSQLQGQPRSHLARLNGDGTLDPGFNPEVAGDSIYSIAVQADGGILIAGGFGYVCGQSRRNLARLNQDGTLDLLFNPGADQVIRALAVQPDGKILAGGWMQTLAGQPCQSLGRLTNTKPATQTLSCDGSTVTWLRGGSSPEVWRTTFEHSINGVAWSLLGEGSRIPGGWQLGGLALPSTGRIRARGFVTGHWSGSGWFVESIIGPPEILMEPCSLTNLTEIAASFRVIANGSEQLYYQWFQNDSPVANGFGAKLTFTNLQPEHAGFYYVVVSNVFGCVTSSVATLTVSQFRPDPEFKPGSFGIVSSLAIQSDGCIWVGGTSWDGFDVVRLLSDGMSDPSFTKVSSYYPELAFALAVDNDDTVLAGGWSLIRLRDGIPDAEFHPAQDRVTSLMLQHDGRIVLGTVNGNGMEEPRTWNVVRLNPDGTQDMPFHSGANSWVRSLTMQPDGKILVGGEFSMLDFHPGIDLGGFVSTMPTGTPRQGIGRLNADGTLDPDFNPESSGPVYSIVLQADGKILIGGQFTSLSGQPRQNLGRLNADGTLDSRFNPKINNVVCTLALQTNGKILVGGEFTEIDGQPRYRIARLFADGTLDPELSLAMDGSVLALALQQDGKILAGGSFENLGKQPYSGLVRLNNADSAIQSLTADDSTVTWLRGGSCPEVWRTAFEYSMDGLNWTHLGSGTRIDGGWQLTGLSLPANGTVRARGHVAGANRASSCWFVESLRRLGYGLNDAPELEIAFIDGKPVLHVTGRIGTACTIEYATALPASGKWTVLSSVTLANRPQIIIDDSFSGSAQRFYRARK